MPTVIHPTAVIHPSAQLGEGCQVGPYAVIDGHVILGPDCHVGPGAYLTGHTRLGSGNRIHAGAVLGDAPQDFKYAGQPTRLRIGNDNIFREHVTVHRSNRLEEDTVLGDGNFLMAGSHVGHNCVLGNHNVLANGALLGGHVVMHDRAFISGSCLVHQFCRIGRLALMQGGAGISLDLPPFTLARDNNTLCGLNRVGLRRAGISTEDRRALQRLYHVLFRSVLPRAERLSQTAADFPQPVCQELIAFVAASTRGLCADPGRWNGSNSDEESSTD
ncbi:MAG: acyl-ACP--UDP-N-acetylglucosamine O-acyltransferase [Limisphaerales bacterium]|jgi:UDP-N-acetylglucosamine acyltransferase